MAGRLDSSSEELVNDDEISLSSSGSEEQEEYTVEGILAERLLDDSSPRYLVKWENYGEERCTWEPAESFLDPRSLQDWARKREAGIQLSDDVIDGIEAKMIAYLDAKESREAVRLKKRKQLAPAKATKSSAKTIASSSSETASHPRRKTAQKTMSLPRADRRPPSSAEAGTVLATARIVRQSKQSDAPSGIAIQTTTADRPVFHGISMPTTKRKVYSARRTRTGSIRNLRHLNNVRKAARRERSPDAKSIQLRSLSEWSKSAPEDTYVQLPPTPVSNSSMLEARVQVSANETRSTSELTFSAQPASITSRGNPSNIKPNVVSDDGGLSDSAAKKDPTAQNRFNPHEKRERTLRTVPSGRSFYYGELLIELKFGKAFVGDVRVDGLPPWAIGQIINLKGSNVILKLEIGSRNVVTPSQWAQLCTGRSNALQPAGVMIPYEDTAKAVVEMESYLYQHNLAALWYHPSADFMLVFYSPRSQSWKFLERPEGLPFDGNIRVLTRNKMPPTEILANYDSVSARASELGKPVLSRANSFSALPHGTDIAPDGGQMVANNNVPQPSRFRRLSGGAGSTTISSTHSPVAVTATLLQARENLKSMHIGESAVGSTLRPFQKSDITNAQPDVIESEPEAFQLRLRPGQSMGEAFESLFKISYAHLTAVPSSKNVDCDPAKARFYLVYPDTAEAELEYLQKFLRSYTFHTNICTSRDGRGWDAFRNIYKGDYIGVILFHEECNHYHTLPRLSSLLRSASLNVFRISLAHPLRDSDDVCHLERLFPSGMAVLLTEACLASNGVTILKWFGRKRRGPSWKLVLPPNIKGRLRRTAQKFGQGVGERYIDILQELDKLFPGFSALRHHSRSDEDSSSEAESIDGMSDGSGQPGPVFAPSVIPAYDKQKGNDEKGKDHVLIEYFAGWAIAHSGYHRKFIAVTPFVDTIYSKWGHIEVVTPGKFMQRESIQSQEQASASKS